MPRPSQSIQLKKVGPRSFRLDRRLAIVGLLAAFLGGARADAQVCVGSAIGFDPGPGNVPAPVNCINFLWCHPPELLSVRYDLTPSTCDPEAQPCSVRAVVPGRFPGNSNNHSGIFPDSPIKLIWNNSMGAFVGSCGNIGARIQVDEGEAWIQASNFSCADPGAAQNTDTYTLTAIACDGVGGCEVQRQATVPLTAQAMSDTLCEPDTPAPGWSCGEGDACDSGCFGPGGGSGGRGGRGGSSAAGGGPGVTPDDNGPGAMLRYLAGGTGSDLHPRPAGWPDALGRYWSHDYAEVLVEDPMSATSSCSPASPPSASSPTPTSTACTRRLRPATSIAASPRPSRAGSCATSTAPSSTSATMGSGPGPSTRTATPPSPPMSPAS